MSGGAETITRSDPTAVCMWHTIADASVMQVVKHIVESCFVKLNPFTLGF